MTTSRCGPEADSQSDSHWDGLPWTKAHERGRGVVAHVYAMHVHERPCTCRGKITNEQRCRNALLAPLSPEYDLPVVQALRRGSNGLIKPLLAVETVFETTPKRPLEHSSLTAKLRPDSTALAVTLAVRYGSPVLSQSPLARRSKASSRAASTGGNPVAS
jgi:hypothetical protein